MFYLIYLTLCAVSPLLLVYFLIEGIYLRMPQDSYQIQYTEH